MERKKKKKEALARFGNRLNQLRKEKHMSFRQLAAQCDVDHSDIKKFENGEKNITILTVIELSIGLGVHPKELLDFDFDFLEK